MPNRLGWDHTQVDIQRTRKRALLFIPDSSVEPEAQAAARPSPLKWPLGSTPELGASLWTIQPPALVEFMADPLPPGRADDTRTQQWIGPQVTRVPFISFTL